MRHAYVGLDAADHGGELPPAQHSGFPGDTAGSEEVKYLVVGEMLVHGGRERWNPHAEGGFVDVADGLVGFFELQRGVGVAEFFAELAGCEDGDVEDAGWGLLGSCDVAQMKRMEVDMLRDVTDHCDRSLQVTSFCLLNRERHTCFEHLLRC